MRDEKKDIERGREEEEDEKNMHVNKQFQRELTRRHCTFISEAFALAGPSVAHGVCCFLAIARPKIVLRYRWPRRRRSGRVQRMASTVALARATATVIGNKALETSSTALAIWSTAVYVCLIPSLYVVMTRGHSRSLCWYNGWGVRGYWSWCKRRRACGF